MPSKNMLPKGQRHHTVRPQYVATRGVEPELPLEVPVLEFEDDADDTTIRTFQADPAAAGLRLDLYLAQALPDRTLPERLYLESKWASLVSYGMTAQLLQDAPAMLQIDRAFSPWI